MRGSSASACRRVSVVLLTLAAGCGASEGSNASGQTQTTGLVPTTSADAAPANEGGSTPSASGDDFIQYSISGGFEAEGEEPFQPSMSFFDSGIWTMTFGGGGAVLVIVNLDPSTPSVNLTNGATSVAGDSSQCTFDVTRQDAGGAAGSFECSDVPVVDSGALTQADSFSGSFDVSP